MIDIVIYESEYILRSTENKEEFSLLKIKFTQTEVERIKDFIENLLDATYLKGQENAAGRISRYITYEFGDVE